MLLPPARKSPPHCQNPILPIFFSSHFFFFVKQSRPSFFSSWLLFCFSLSFQFLLFCAFCFIYLTVLSNFTSNFSSLAPLLILIYLNKIIYIIYFFIKFFTYFLFMYFIFNFNYSTPITKYINF